ncbi:MAG: hypothetical protein V7K64_04235 [Nostoc sp.]|uniref:hypothetical protein n=2 Tax=Nostoc sp. TaxID=1180 RepID=UPI002FF8D884
MPMPYWTLQTVYLSQKFFGWRSQHSTSVRYGYGKNWDSSLSSRLSEGVMQCNLSYYYEHTAVIYHPILTI